MRNQLSTENCHAAIEKPLLADSKNYVMTRNEELIEKYKRYIKKMERELEETKDDKRIIYLEGKISVYKMVIIDLQE